jgi:RIO kinase 1
MSRVDELLYPTKKERFEDRRKEDHQRVLLDEFFDHATLVAISRLINQGQFDSIDYPISTGKEGGVFRASGAGGFRAVKVYRIGNSIFRRLPPYVMEELLREVGAHQRGRLIFAWARREHTILRRLTDAGVRCPQPYGYLRNVLVMEFIGEDGRPAAPLQETQISDPGAFFEELVEQVRRSYGRAGLVHADLSPYNLLVLREHPVLIDVAQSLAVTHPQAAELLARDVANLAKYFRRLGVDATSEAMLHEIRRPFDGPAPGS